MTRKELLELAALDALGLLDEFEARAYARSFHHAPAAVQDEVLRLQAEVAADETLLGSEKPDPALRQRVLEAVADAIEREDAPLATIGGRIRGDEAPGRRLWGSGQFWRAASFVLAGIAVVFAWNYGEAKSTSNLISKLALSDNTDEVLEELIGPTVTDYLFDAEARRVVLTPAGGAETGVHAVVFINEHTRRALLVTDGLPQAVGEQYTLAWVGADRNDRAAERFGSPGGVQGIDLGVLPRAALAAARWEIVDSAGAVLLTSA